MGKYERINPWEVFGVLTSCDLDIMNPLCGTINLINIASLLHTSRYQVKKAMDYLVRIGVAERAIVMLPEDPEDDAPYPPYHGYRLTEAVKHKGGDKIPAGLDIVTMLRYRSAYQKKLAEEIKLLNLCFGN